jgi:glycine cleavage system H protein
MPDSKEARYHHEHAWAKVSGKRAVLGISDYAQDQLGEIVYIDLPDEGTRTVKGSEICEIESSKVVSSFIAPLSGTIVRVNEDLRDAADLVNASPLENGWIVEIEMADSAELADLLSPEAYLSLVEGR